MGKVTKNKMVVKQCPNCENQVPVACKQCRCGHAFFNKRLLHSNPGGGGGGETAGGGTGMEEDSSGVKRRRTERVRRERPDYYSASEFENHLRRISTSKSGEKGEDKSSKKKHRRGRPKGSQNKSIEEIEEERERDLYSNLPTDKAFVYAVSLAEINEKLQMQSQEWKPPTTEDDKKSSQRT